MRTEICKEYFTFYTDAKLNKDTEALFMRFSQKKYL